MENKVSELDQFKTNKEKRDFIKSQIDRLSQLIVDYDGVELEGDDKIDFLLACVTEKNKIGLIAHLDGEMLYNILVQIGEELDCAPIMALVSRRIMLPELNIVNQTPKTPHDIN
jgi:hypothetical protein